MESRQRSTLTVKLTGRAKAKASDPTKIDIARLEGEFSLRWSDAVMPHAFSKSTATSLLLRLDSNSLRGQRSPVQREECRGTGGMVEPSAVSFR